MGSLFDRWMCFWAFCSDYVFWFCLAFVAKLVDAMDLGSIFWGFKSLQRHPVIIVLYFSFSDIWVLSAFQSVKNPIPLYAYSRGVLGLFGFSTYCVFSLLLNFNEILLFIFLRFHFFNHMDIQFSSFLSASRAL